MDDARINFRLPAETLKAIDEEAAADHRDRTSMMHKIIAYWFENNPPRKAVKKAGSR
jgi:Ribbon-helix-helix protein, copG family